MWDEGVERLREGKKNDSMIDREGWNDASQKELNLRKDKEMKS